MHSPEPPDTPQTEGQTVPPEEQIIPSGGGPIMGHEATQEVHEQGSGKAPTESANKAPTESADEAPTEAPTPEGQTRGPEDQAQGSQETGQEPLGAAAGQAKSLAQQNPNPIALAAAFVAGIVIGRMASRWG